MLFNSYIFLLAFFPLSLLIYFSLNRAGRYKSALWVLVAMSLCFYAYFHFWYLFILVGSIVINWFISRILVNTKSRFVLCCGIVLNVAEIFVFKYFDFFIENINILFKSSLPLLNILMPLGISFFTFQQLSYIVDSYRGETADHSFTEYALFVSFFPQLIAGPIVSHKDMIHQFRNPDLKKFNSDNFAKGLYHFSIGLAKKVLLADSLAKGVNWGYANIEKLGSFNVLLVVFFYSFQLYFDFSGYCDMAYGISECFNLKIPANFLSPYKASSIGDFWKRWHTTLTRFLTNYIYIPLGGSRRGKTRTLINIMLVFLISGLWHGANWTFVIWGAMHGLAMVLYRISNNLWDRIAKPIRIFFTYLFVSFAWIPFRAKSLGKAIMVFSSTFSKPDFSLNKDFLSKYNFLEFTYPEEHISFLKNIVVSCPSVHMWIILALSVFIVFFTKNIHEKEFRPKAANALITIILLVWSIISLSGMSTFLYFNF